MCCVYQTDGCVCADLLYLAVDSRVVGILEVGRGMEVEDCSPFCCRVEEVGSQPCRRERILFSSTGYPRIRHYRSYFICRIFTLVLLLVKVWNKNHIWFICTRLSIKKDWLAFNYSVTFSLKSVDACSVYRLWYKINKSYHSLTMYIEVKQQYALRKMQHNILINLASDVFGLFYNNLFFYGQRKTWSSDDWLTQLLKRSHWAALMWKGIC